MTPLLRNVIARIGSRTALPFRVHFADGSTLQNHPGDPVATFTFKTQAAQLATVVFGHIGLLDAYFDRQIEIDGDQVSISAEVKQEKEVKEGARVVHSERYYGKVSRAFRLGQEIDQAGAVAKFADGVLELTLPKKAAASRKQITIS